MEQKQAGNITASPAVLPGLEPHPVLSLDRY